MNPACCPVCGGRYTFKTDGPCGIGRLIAVHPPGPCIPKVEPEFPIERGGRPKLTYTPKDAECVGCRQQFKSTKSRHRFCSADCRTEYLKRCRLERRAEMARPCLSCGKTFVPLKHNQGACSGPCTRALRREYALDYYRANPGKWVAA